MNGHVNGGLLRPTSRSWISSLALSLAFINLAIFVGIAIFGYARGVTYPNPPHWFEAGSMNCFWVALSMMIVSLVMLLFPINRNQCAVAASVNFVTAGIIAFLTTNG